MRSLFNLWVRSDESYRWRVRATGMRQDWSSSFSDKQVSRNTMFIYSVAGCGSRATRTRSMVGGPVIPW